MSRHTAGPWSVAGTTVYALEHEGWRRGSEVFRNRFDARAQGPHCPIDELEANARLIAAAPELLDVLLSIQADQSWRTNDNTLWTRINDVIRRATQPLPTMSEES